MTNLFRLKYTNPDFILFDDTRSVILLKDKREGRQYVLNNSSRQKNCAYRVDGGIQTANDEKKCDFAISLADDRLIFVELKGTDKGRAAEQILSSITKLVQEPKLQNHTIYGRIVLSRDSYPKIKHAVEQKLEKLLRSYNGNLEIKSRKLEESIEKLHTK